MPAFDPRITWGNILSVFILIFGGAIAWGVTTTQIAQAKTEIIGLSDRLDRQDAIVRQFEPLLARQDERYVAIMRTLDKIDKRLEGVAP